MDDWKELEAPTKVQVRDEPVTFGTVELRHGQARAAFSVAERVMAEVGWPRYRISWNANRRQFRVVAAADGGFEGFKPVKTKGPGLGRVCLRAPLPDELVVLRKVKVGVVHELRGGALIVTIPSKFWAKKP